MQFLLRQDPRLNGHSDDLCMPCTRDREAGLTPDGLRAVLRPDPVFVHFATTRALFTRKERSAACPLHVKRPSNYSDRVTGRKPTSLPRQTIRLTAVGSMDSYIGSKATGPPRATGTDAPVGRPPPWRRCARNRRAGNESGHTSESLMSRPRPRLAAHRLTLAPGQSRKTLLARASSTRRAPSAGDKNLSRVTRVTAASTAATYPS